VQRPEALAEIGYFEAREFNPRSFNSIQSNSAFVNLTDRDGYWAAKIISAFSDDHLKAIVAEAHYHDPAAARYMIQTLAQRRDKIARCYFDRTTPLDFFQQREGAIIFRDLGAERDIYPGSETRYRVRCAAVDAKRRAKRWSRWTELGETRLPLQAKPVASAEAFADREQFPFLAIECQLDRGQGWSRPVRCYLSRSSGRVVGVDR
jgi:hypothetical protein